MRIRYKKELYSRNILFRTCYAFTDQAYIHLDADADSYIVTISPKEEGDQKPLLIILSKLQTYQAVPCH